MRAPTFVGTMILSLTKAMHWFETCQGPRHQKNVIYLFLCRSMRFNVISIFFCIDQFKRQVHLVCHHLHVTLLVASDDHCDELGSEKTLFSLRRKMVWL